MLPVCFYIFFHHKPKYIIGEFKKLSVLKSCFFKKTFEIYKHIGNIWDFLRVRQ